MSASPRREKPSPSSGDGWPAKDVFSVTRSLNNGAALTYDDLIFLPGHIYFPVESVDLTTKITKGGIELKVPLISSPMDTVTGAEMAISLALQGGLGIIHGCQDAKKQAEAIANVKRYENGFIMSPICMSPHERISDLDSLKQVHGYSSVPITANGRNGSKLLGIVTSRDVDLIEDRSIALKDVMTTDLVVGTEPISLQQANEKLQESKVGKLPIVNCMNELVALVTRTDLKTNKEYPLASKDSNKQLLVGAAIPVLGACENDEAFERATLCIEAGADVICLDSEQGDSSGQINFLKRLKLNFPNTEVIAGNVVSCRQAKHLLDAGADALKVGMGSGSGSISGDVSAIGRPQATSVYTVSKYAKEYGNIPILADGGVANSGQLMKAIGLGAAACVCGSLFAGTEEAPGDYFYHNGLRVKAFRGRSMAGWFSSSHVYGRGGSSGGVRGPSNSDGASNKGHGNNNNYTSDAITVTKDNHTTTQDFHTERTSALELGHQGTLGSHSPSSRHINNMSNKRRISAYHAMSGGYGMLESRIKSGVAGAVIDKGTISELVPYILQGCRHGMQDLGYRNINELHVGLYSGDLRMEIRSVAAQKEGAVHDLKSSGGREGNSKIVHLNNRWC